MWNENPTLSYYFKKLSTSEVYFKKVLTVEDSLQCHIQDIQIFNLG